MYEIHYRCSYRDWWYYHSTVDDLAQAQAIARAVAYQRHTVARVVDFFERIIYRTP